MPLNRENAAVCGWCHEPYRQAESAQRSIRRRYAAGEVSLADLATEYSVGRSTIHRVIHRAPAADAGE
jgi:hypothetical protein